MTFTFKSKTQRFDPKGLHPQLITINLSNKLGPGQYVIKEHDCAYKQNASSWQTKQVSEEFSKYLGHKFPRVLEQRCFQRTLGGPGTYDLFDCKAATCGSKRPGVGFGLEKRFVTFFKQDQPPPGTYTEKKRKRRFTCRQTFAFDVTARFKDTEPDYSKAPNRYNLPHKSILDHVVSERGPYDTFTGPRDQTSIKNHFAPPLFIPPDKWYPMPSAMDFLLFHPSKSRCGKFFQAKRFPKNTQIRTTKNGFTMFEKDSNFPCPSAYAHQNSDLENIKPNAKPFLSSNIYAREPENWEIRPGADRYLIKYPKCTKKGMKNWMFLTKYNRSIYENLKTDYNW